MRKDNKGFSLVELIIVIAIMAILVGVMAPQLIKYIEKTNVSADTQLCDAIHTAVLYAAMDPTVLSDPNSQVPIGWFTDGPATGNWTKVWAYVDNSSEFGRQVIDTLGFDPGDGAADMRPYFKSTPAKISGNLGIIVTANEFFIYIEHSDNSAGKADYTHGDPDKVIMAPTWH